MSTIVNIQNEIVNYIAQGARFDMVYYRGTKTETLFEMVDSPQELLSQVTINVSNQKHGTIVKSWVINQTALPTFEWVIQAADLQNEKPLHYWVDAVDQDGELLFYGTFTLL